MKTVYKTANEIIKQIAIARHGCADSQFIKDKMGAYEAALRYDCVAPCMPNYDESKHERAFDLLLKEAVFNGVDVSGGLK